MQTAIKPEKIIGVPMDYSEFETFQAYADYLHRQGILETDKVSELLLISARYSLKIAKDAARRDREHQIQQQNRRPEHFVEDAVRQIDSMNYDLDKQVGYY